MKSTRLLQAVRVFLLLPTLGITVAVAVSAPAKAQPDSPTAQLSPLAERNFSQSLTSIGIPLSPSQGDQTLNNTLLRMPFSYRQSAEPATSLPSSAPPEQGPDQRRRQGQERKEDNNDNNQQSDRLRQRLWIEAIGSTLEVNTLSGTLQQGADSLDEDEETYKESFGLAIERPIRTSRRAEFSWSLGFDYRDESLTLPATSSLGIGFPLDSNRPTTRPRNQQPQGPSSNPASSNPLTNNLPTNNLPTNNLPTNNPLPNRSLPNRPVINTAIANRGIPNRLPLSPSGPIASPEAPANEPPTADEELPAPLRSRFGDTTDAQMQTGIVKFAQSYRQRDRAGQWLARSQFNLGTELSETPDEIGSDAQFFSWAGRVERTQTMGNDHRLTLRLDTQLSPHSLLSMHQFKMEDRRFSSFSRSARPTEISGNNGVRLYLEDRIVLMRNDTQTPMFSLVPFVDAGYTWGQRSNPQNPRQQFLGRTGVGMLIEPLPGFDIQFDYLTHWGDLNANADTQNHYITLTYETRW
ncbi:MAG: hypothetical protein AB8B99_06475 [Phormidesmis sp.]